ncbi:hypothetical protein GGX14DRAFT_197174 [Mycena pura]|uniref:DUF6532 domain-containing protein n=1 Tax=Mycena pura TaxID=153505 RepID=A0AAD6UW61_9AGAR|nr:hypothetical protein GGX14DRAFT_197174 [Mycena pura]
MANLPPKESSPLPLDQRSLRVSSDSLSLLPFIRSHYAGFVAIAVHTSRNKENVPLEGSSAHATRSNQSVKYVETHENSDNDHDNDEDYEQQEDPLANEGDVEMDQDDNEQDQRPSGRPRRNAPLTEKAQQLLDDEEEAEQTRQRKRAKAAARAARDAGENIEDGREPIPDTNYETRDIDTRHLQVKHSAPRAAARDARRSSPHREDARDLAPLGKVIFGAPRSALQLFDDERDERRSRRQREERRIVFDKNGQPIEIPGPGRFSTRMPERCEAWPTSTPTPRSPVASSSRGRLATTTNSSPLPPSRSSSPVAGDKRPPSPSPLPEEEARTSTRSARPTIGALPEDQRELAAMAIDLLRCDITVNEAFPGSVEEKQIIKKLFKTCLEELELSTKLTPIMYRVIAGRYSHTRGELKNKGRPIVDTGFQFRMGSNPRAIKHNRQLVEDLKEELSFAYKDPVARKGLYQQPIIQKLINAMYFANRRDEGPSHPEVFSPFPLRGLALILTVIENCIDEWATGTHIDIDFKMKDYEPIYRTHIQALEAFDARGPALGQILARIHDVGRFHSGAAPLADAAPKPILSAASLDAAMEEYANGVVFSDDEGEDDE